MFSNVASKIVEERTDAYVTVLTTICNIKILKIF